MAVRRISTESTEYVLGAVEVLDENGNLVDPTGDAVEMAIIPRSQSEPATLDWKTAAWETGTDTFGQITYRARLLIGPAAVPPKIFAEGEYAVWVRVHDIPEVPVLRAGTLLVFSSQPSSVLDPGDIEAATGRSFDEDTFLIVENLIQRVQGYIEAYLNRSIQVLPYVKETHSLPWDATLVYLSNTPVVSIQGVWVNGNQITDTDLFWQAPWGVALSGWGWSLPSISSGAWASPTATYEVSYTGGLDGANIPAIRGILIKGILTELAKVKAGDSELLGYISLKAEDFSWQKAPVTVTGVTTRGSAVGFGPFASQDLKVLDQFRRRLVIGGVPSGVGQRIGQARQLW